MTQANAEKTTFEDSYFVLSKFHHTNMRHATFHRSGLLDIDFKDSSFAHATFTEARFRGNFNDTDFSHAKIEKSKIVNSDFSGAKLEGVTLTGSVYDCQTRWPEGFDPKAAGAALQYECPPV